MRYPSILNVNLSRVKSYLKFYIEIPGNKYHCFISYEIGGSSGIESNCSMVTLTAIISGEQISEDRQNPAALNV